MLHFEGIADAGNACRRFFIQNEDGFPEHVRPRLETLTDGRTSPVDLCSGFVRVVYANIDAVPKGALEIAAGAADLFDQEGYHDRLGGRALGIRKALQRANGEKGSFGDPKKDPSFDAEFLPPPTPESEPKP